MAALCERFLTDYASPRLKDLAAYRRTAASRLRRVLPHIGEVRLAELGRAHVIRARDGLSRRYPAGNHAHQPDRADGGLFLGRAAGAAEKNPRTASRRPPSPSPAVDFLGPMRCVAWSRRQKGGCRARPGWRLRCGDRDRWRCWGFTPACAKADLWPALADLNLDSGRLTIAHSYGTTPKSGRARHLKIPSVLLDVLLAWKRDCPKTARGLVVASAIAAAGICRCRQARRMGCPTCCRRRAVRWSAGAGTCCAIPSLRTT